jgi:hypothetical protein
MPTWPEHSTTSTTTSLLATIGLFPDRDMIRQWLTAGVIEKGRFAPTGEGAPQGGVISALLMNVALHGMEPTAGVRYRRCGDNTAETKPESPVLVKYADEYVALCHSREHAEHIEQQLSTWLAQRGLAHNTDKTTTTPATTEFDFLGCNIRRYPCGKLLIKPSKTAVTRIRRRLAEEMRSLRGAAPAVIIGRLNPIITGWAAYYRGVVSTQTFHTLDHYLWRLTYRWALRRHPNKPRKWIKARYFGPFHPPVRTGGSSETATTAPSCADSPGRRLSGTRWSPARLHPTTLPWPTTGPPGAADSHPHRWTAPPCAYSRHSTAAVPAAGTTCCTPTSSHNPPTNGNNGCTPPARPSPNNGSATRSNAVPRTATATGSSLCTPPCQRRSPPTAAPQHPTQITRTPSGLA